MTPVEFIETEAVEQAWEVRELKPRVRVHGDCLDALTLDGGKSVPLSLQTLVSLRPCPTLVGFDVTLRKNDPPERPFTRVVPPSTIFGSEQ